MAELSFKVVAYLGREPDFREEVILQDDGSGPYIKEWNITSEKSKPTDSQLNALDAEATKLENNAKARIKRKDSYGKIGDQLDLLYKDLVAGKLDATGELAKKIKAVKDANPKE